MARGVSQQAQNDATQITAQNNALNEQNQQQLQQLQTGYGNILANPGYTPGQQSAITNATMGGLGGTFDNLSNQIKTTAARTGNEAGVTGGLDKLAMTHGADAATLAAKNQAGFAQDAQSQQMEALKGLSSIYGMDVDELAKQLGIPANYLNTANAASPKFSLGLGPGGLSAGFSS